MSEPIGLNLEVGGDLPASLVPELIQTLKGDLYDINGGPTDVSNVHSLKGPVSWYATSNWGECDDLKIFLRKNYLSYIHKCDASGEYDASVSYWIPGMKAEWVLQGNTNGDVVLAVDAIKPLCDLLLSLAESGPKALPLFIDSKSETVKEIVQKALKTGNHKRIYTSLRKHIEALMPTVPTLPPFRIAR